MSPLVRAARLACTASTWISGITGTEMSKRGQQSTAHRYDSRGCCIYCGTYRVSVEAMSLECTPKREAEEDALSESQIEEIKEDISDIRSVLEKMERQIDNHHR